MNISINVIIIVLFIILLQFILLYWIYKSKIRGIGFQMDKCKQCGGSLLNSIINIKRYCAKCDMYDDYQIMHKIKSKPHIFLNLPISLWLFFIGLIGACIIADNLIYHEAVSFNTFTSILLIIVLVINKNKKNSKQK